MNKRTYCSISWWLSSEFFAGIFKQSMGPRNRAGIGCRSGPLGYTACRNWFLGIDSRSPKKFRNSGSGSQPISWTLAKSWLKSHLSAKVGLSPLFLNNGLQGSFSPPGENNCSCAVESVADSANEVDLFEKVAQLPFQSTSVQGLSKKPKRWLFSWKGDFSAERVPFQQTHHVLELRSRYLLFYWTAKGGSFIMCTENTASARTTGGLGTWTGILIDKLYAEKVPFQLKSHHFGT